MNHSFTVTYNNTPRTIEVDLIIAVRYEGKTAETDMDLDERRGFVELITQVAHKEVATIEQAVRKAVEK
jgi:hypothetical protein